MLASLLPALAFLLAGVALAAMLDRLGFFDAVISLIAGRNGRAIPAWTLWVLAAVTTIVLNLDTTVVLLTPLSLRLARRSGVDPLAVAAVPLLQACLASSVLPVSNLTTLIVAARLDVGVWSVVSHLALPSLVAIGVGWLVHRRRLPKRLEVDGGAEVDLRALRIGGLVVVGVLAGFVAGPAVGVAAWMVALVADLVLMAVVRHVPWRQLPVVTAVVVAVVAVIVHWVAPHGIGLDHAGLQGPADVAALVMAGAGTANAVNNLPALLVSLGGMKHMSWALWAWLLGVNTGAVLLPIGALANVLWRRIVRRDGVDLTLRSYVTMTAPAGLAGLVAATAMLVIERLLW